MKDKVEGNKKKIHTAPIIITLVFVVAVIAFAVGIRTYPIITMFVLIVAVASLFLFSVLNAYTMEEYREFKMAAQLSESSLNNSQKLLRYSAAVMAFLSWTTTAMGMKGYVFDDTWKAYLASFGIQSVLVVLSLLLCRFFAAAGQSGIPKHIRKIFCASLILFLILFMSASTVFSYACIANNAYKETWASDRETMVREYFQKEANNLQEENTRLGNIILTQLEELVQGNLQNQLDNVSDGLLKQAVEDVKIYLNAIDNTLYSASVEYDISSLAVSEASDAEVSSISAAYQIYVNTFDETVSSYNNCKSEMAAVQLDDGSEDNDLSSILIKIESQKSTLENRMNSLSSLLNTIDDLRTSNLFNDFEPVRNIFKSEANRLIEEIQSYISYLDNIEDIIEEYESNISFSNAQSTSSITKRVYALEISNTKEEDARELAGDISEILATVINDEDYSDTDVETFVSLNRLIQQYIEYLELNDAIEEFKEEHAGVTYQIDRDGDLTEDEITEREWSDIRRAGFNTLIECVNSLPDVSESDSDGDNGNMISEENSTGYTQEVVLNEASKMQRDFFGNLTEFEQAYNYFKYDYKVMACFSAFMALFLDLSAFWVGCFLFFSDTFKDKPESVNCTDSGL